MPNSSETFSLSVHYALEPHLSAHDFRDVLIRSTLGERRPIDEPQALEKMLANADLIVTARVEGRLVGVARSLTDHAFCTYLSDLAVDEAYQKRGIGRELIRRTHEAAGLETTLILLAAPKARTYYPRVAQEIGMTAHDACWVIPSTRRANPAPPPR